MQQVPLLHHNVARDGGFHETLYFFHSDYEVHFRVKVSILIPFLLALLTSGKPRVKRSFSFEELQSGLCFQFFDEYDHQFYRVYGQPLFIPCDLQEGFVSHDHSYLLSLLHYPYYQQQPTSSSSIRPPLHHKSYTLVGSLGNCTSHTVTHSGSHSELSIPAYSYDHGA